MKTRIWVRYHETAGPIVVEQNGEEQQARRVEIDGPSSVIYRKGGEQPHIVIETESPVRVT